MSGQCTAAVATNVTIKSENAVKRVALFLGVQALVTPVPQAVQVLSPAPGTDAGGRLPIAWLGAAGGLAVRLR